MTIEVVTCETTQMPRQSLGLIEGDVLLTEPLKLHQIVQMQQAKGRFEVYMLTTLADLMALGDEASRTAALSEKIMGTAELTNITIKPHVVLDLGEAMVVYIFCDASPLVEKYLSTQQLRSLPLKGCGMEGFTRHFFKFGVGGTDLASELAGFISRRLARPTDGKPRVDQFGIMTLGDGSFSLEMPNDYNVFGVVNSFFASQKCRIDGTPEWATIREHWLTQEHNNRLLWLPGQEPHTDNWTVEGESPETTDYVRILAPTNVKDGSEVRVQVTLYHSERRAYLGLQEEIMLEGGTLEHSRSQGFALTYDAALDALKGCG